MCTDILAGVLLILVLILSCADLDVLLDWTEPDTEPESQTHSE